MEQGIFSLFNFKYTDISFWILQTIAICVTCRLIPNLKITSFLGPILTVICLALVNSRIWDAALFFSVPDSLTSQTLVLFLANGVIFWVLVKLLPGIEVKGFFPAFIAPVVFTLTSLAIGYLVENVDWPTFFSNCWQFLQDTKDYVSQNASSVPTPEPTAIINDIPNNNVAQ